MPIKVSVIIPAYNAEKTIARTLSSVVTQTLDEVEIIVVINGTTDNTYEVTEKVLSNQTRFPWYTILEEEGNVGKARNIGIDRAKGEFLFFLDSDDYIENTALEKLYKTATKDSADIAFCGFRKENSRSEITFNYDQLFHYYYSPETGMKALQDFLVGSIWICISTGLFKRRIIIQNSIRFSEKYSSGEDQCFIMYCLYYAKFVASFNEVLSTYFAHSFGLSASNRVFESVYLFEGFVNFLKDNPKKVDRKAVEKTIYILIYYKIPYLLARNFYRYAKNRTYTEFLKVKKSNGLLLKKYKMKLYPKNKHSKFGIYGYFLLRHIPLLFYYYSNKRIE